MADQYFDTAAELGSEEEDEDFEDDEGQGKVRSKAANGVALEDSSDEDEEDDDELLAQVRAPFRNLLHPSSR